MDSLGQVPLGLVQGAAVAKRCKLGHAQKPNVVTVPGNSGDDVPIGTLKAILKAAGLEDKR